jgi:hypothetical protein
MLLAGGAAQAQSPGWNLVQPQYCFEYASSSDGQIVSTLFVYTQTYAFQVADDVMKGAILQWCYNSSAFYGCNACEPLAPSRKKLTYRQLGRWRLNPRVV